MGNRLDGRAIQEVHTLFKQGAMGSWNDRQLMAQSLTGQEGREAALRVLISRHGPMVLGLSRRILGNSHAAEDAFQTTFLVLVKKAEKLRDCEGLTNWLYGVALRVAKKERAKAARRRLIERRAANTRATGRGDDLERAELRSVIDEEIARLPERLRVPLILCHLEGLQHEEVARRLGCPLGTVESRLSRARQQLRSRLDRRGLAPIASVLALALSHLAPPSALAVSALVEPTLKAAIHLTPWRAGVVAKLAYPFGRQMLRLAPSLPGGVIASKLIVCTGIIAIGFAAFQADRQRRQRDAIPTKPSPNLESRADVPAAKTGDLEVVAPRIAPISEPIPTPPQTADLPRPSRSSAAHAPSMAGITIDGQLDDWPATMPRYPIQKLLLYGQIGHPESNLLKDTNSLASSDLSAEFSVGYDPKTQLVYLAVIVRDDKVVIGHTSPRDTDAVEVFVDGLHGTRSVPNTFSPEEFNKLELPHVPVQQYITIPGEGKIYGMPQETNPILVAGDLKRTKTRMAYKRVKDVTTYEWAIQVFDRYPDRPSKLEPGKRIGFDIAVADIDVPPPPPGSNQAPQTNGKAWLYWGPRWNGIKLLDAGALGELILVK
jgi:RNA polymerase sigma factor (sigma-70 family)